MLSIKFIRENIDALRKTVSAKNADVDLEQILQLDIKRREIIQEADILKAKRNNVSDLIAARKKQGESSEQEISEMKTVSTAIKSLDTALKEVISKLDKLLLYIPNTVHESVPEGLTPEDNIVIREWGSKPDGDIQYKDHFELCENLKLLDFPRASKMSGSGFPLYTGLGAKLERSLINYMLDFHLERTDATFSCNPRCNDHYGATSKIRRGYVPYTQ